MAKLDRVPLKVYTLEELNKVVAAQEELLARQVYVNGDYVVFNIEYPYEIAFDRCSTPDALLSWVWHMTEKRWMTPLALRRFMELVAARHGFTATLVA